MKSSLLARDLGDRLTRGFDRNQLGLAGVYSAQEEREAGRGDDESGRIMH